MMKILHCYPYNVLGDHVLGDRALCNTTTNDVEHRCNDHLFKILSYADCSTNSTFSFEYESDLLKLTSVLYMTGSILL